MVASANSAAPPASAVAAGKVRRMRHVFSADGHAVMVALDHAAYQGTGPPHAHELSSIAAGKPEAVLLTWQLARAAGSVFAECGLVLRVDGGVSEIGEPAPEDNGTLLYDIDDALEVDADCVVTLAFPGARDEHRSLERLARLCADAERSGMPVMAEVIPGGWGKAVPWSVENIARSARICAELGADIIKTVCPADPRDFADVVAATPVPVVALGGPRMESEEDVVALARGAVAAGAAGIAFGRNVWGSPDPCALLARLHTAVHGASVQPG